jgi:phosphate transport system substrate-binding protein
MRNRPVAIMLTLALTTLALFAATGCGRSDSAVVTITGSTTMEPLTGFLARTYREKNRANIVITAGGSHNGIKALIDGSCTIADSSARITAPELERARERGIVIKEFRIARGMIVPIVHPSNPVRNVTMQQLGRIYAGTLRSWEDLGGTGAIEATGRDESSGTHDVWRRLVLRETPPGPGITAVASNSMVLARVAKNPGAIGYVEYAFLNTEVRALRVDGNDPAMTAEGKSSAYPLTRDLYLYTSDTCFNGETRKFIVFTLSREGQEAVRKAGFLPVGATR